MSYFIFNSYWFFWIEIAVSFLLFFLCQNISLNIKTIKPIENKKATFLYKLSKSFYSDAYSILNTLNLVFLSVTLGKESNIHIFLFLSVILHSQIFEFYRKSNFIIHSIVSIILGTIFIFIPYNFKLLHSTEQQSMFLNAYIFTSLILTSIFLIYYSAKNFSEKYEGLTLANEKLDSIIENTPNFIWLIDTDYKLVSFNTNFQTNFSQLYQIKLETGMDIVKAVYSLYPEMSIGWKNKYDRAFLGEKFIVEEEYFIEDNYFAIQVSFNPVYYKGKVQRVSIYALDITKRKKMENEISEKNKQLNQLIDLIPGVVFKYRSSVSSENNQFLYISKRSKDIFGIEPDELMQEPHLLENTILAEYASNIRTSIQNAYSNGSVYLSEFPIRNKVGELKWLESRSIPETLSNGEQIWYGIIQDITEIKNREEELSEAKKKIEKAYIDKNTFFSTMSHEIRTPLNAIIGAINLFSTENLSKKDIEKLNILKFTSTHLKELLDDILDIHKLDESKIVLQEEEFSVKNLIDSIYLGFIEQTKKKNIEFELLYDASIPEILIGDATRIKQILLNLLSNSVKFTEKGKIQFSIDISYEDKKTVQLFFKIVDTGIGIPASQIQSIFDNFIQASPDVYKKYGGSGVGLSVVKRLLTLMGSKINLISKPNLGTEFSFHLNLKRAETSKKAKKVNKFNFFNSELALIVDDVEFNRVIASEFLENWGCRVETANSGEESIEKCNAKKYDIILMDLLMPGIDGAEAALKIRNDDNSINKATPIILLTASIIKSEISSFHQNIDEIIFKPFDPMELNYTLYKYLKKTNC